MDAYELEKAEICVLQAMEIDDHSTRVCVTVNMHNLFVISKADRKAIIEVRDGCMYEVLQVRVGVFFSVSGFVQHSGHDMF